MVAHSGSSGPGTDVAATLRRVRPSKVYAIVGDERRALAVPRAGASGRWDRVARSIADLDAEAVEMCDEKDALLARVQLVEDAPSHGPAAGPRATEDERLLSLLLRAQSIALEQQRSSMQGITGAYQALAEVLSSRLSSMEQTYTAVLKAVYESTVARAEADAERIRAAADANDAGLDSMAKDVMASAIANNPQMQKLIAGMANGGKG